MDLTTRLQTALGGGYRLERELGGGGMSRLRRGRRGAGPQGRGQGVTAAVARLRSAATPRDSLSLVWRVGLCASLLEATAATLERRSDALRLVERVDSLMRVGPPLFGGLPYENLVIGRLFGALGDPARGLAAIRRGGPFGNDVIVTSYLREEGRLAALTGDRAGAIRAYNRYLDLRPHPEPAVQPRVDEVKAELARLVGEGGGR